MKTTLRKTILGLSILFATSSAYAAPTLHCYVGYTPMKKTEIDGQHVRIGTGFGKDDVRPDLSNTEPTFFGRAITIDLGSMKTIETSKRITKVFTNHDFGGEVSVSIGLWYSGSLNGLSATVEHRKPNGKQLAYATVDGPLSTEFPVRTTMYSERKGLASVEVECQVAK